MKILITCFDIADYGGIVNYVEILTRAFRELGHDVGFIMLRDTPRDPYTRQVVCRAQGAYPSQVGTQVHVRSGWYGVPVYSYSTSARRKVYRNFAATFDVVIHAIPCPAWTANGSWKKVFMHRPVPQYLMSHDAWFPEHYPYMIEYANCIDGVFAAHAASFHTLREFPVRRCFSGFPLLPVETQAPRWRDRPTRWMSAHMWKALKHMDLVVQAIPVLAKRMPEARHWIGGDGIVGRYMRAPTKCPKRWEGMWARAMKAGLKWADEVPALEVRRQMRRSRVMVDLSYSKAYMRHGALVNTVTFEALSSGAVPLLIEDSTWNRDGKIFENGVTHVGIPWQGISPKTIACAIQETLMMDPADAERIVQAGRDLLNTHWHYHKVAKTYLQFMAGKNKVGVYRRCETGTLTPAILAASAKRLAQVSR